MAPKKASAKTASAKTASAKTASAKTASAKTASARTVYVKTAYAPLAPSRTKSARNGTMMNALPPAFGAPVDGMGAVVATRQKKEVPCRLGEFEKYRDNCWADEQGCRASLVDQCKAFGVGGDLWPEFKWRLTDDQYKAIGPEKVHDGKKCLDKYMWEDANFRKDIATKCPDDVVVRERLAGPPAPMQQPPMQQPPMPLEGPTLQQLFGFDKRQQQHPRQRSPSPVRKPKSKAAAKSKKPATKKPATKKAVRK
jgi:hypothetical protein